MSERPIQVGDLVQVVRWPCCGRSLGDIFKVHVFESAGCNLRCKCGVPLPDVDFALGEGSRSTRYGAPPEWLKRIPPLSDLEVERTQEPTTERV